MVTRSRVWLALIAALLGLLGIESADAQQSQPAKRRPNVLIILADDK